MTLREALREATETLSQFEDQARLEASLLLEHSLGQSRSWIIAHDDEPLPPELTRPFRDMLERRNAGEPLAYITGEREFWSLRLHVTQDVLIPRPDTELLVEVALETAKDFKQPAIADLGTGSGAIAIALASERTDASITATDVSPAALAVAIGNAHNHCPGGINFKQSDWYSGLGQQRFDLIVSNPPYIEANDTHLPALRHEPLNALVSGNDGLNDLRTITQQAPAHLNDGGWLLVEHGHQQGASVRDLFGAAGFVDIATRQDLAARDRVTLGRHDD